MFDSLSKDIDFKNTVININISIMEYVISFYIT